MDSESWQNAGFRVQRARDLLRRARLPEALEELRAAVELEPDDADHHFELGRCFELLGRDAEAADRYERAAELAPDRPDAWASLGGVWLAMERWRDAVAAFDRVERLRPDFEPCYSGRVWALAELGQHERCEEMFYLAQQLRDDRPWPFYHVGRSLAARGQTAKALWCLRQCEDLCAAHPLPAGRRGEYICRHHEPAWLATEAIVRAAEIHAAAGDHEAARRQFLRALSRDGCHVEALLGLAELLLSMRRFAEAGARIRRAVRLEPDEPHGHYVAGRRYLALGKLNEAHVALRRTVELSPGYPRAHLYLARIAARQEDAAEVRRQGHLEMTRRPDEPETLSELGSLLMDVGDLEHAVACFKRLVAIEPGDSRAWQNLGVAECWRGEHMAGVVASRRAVKLDPSNLAAANNLGLAFLDLGELDAAAKVIADGLALDPKHPPLRRLRLRLRLRRLGLRARAVGRRLLPLHRGERGDG